MTRQARCQLHILIGIQVLINYAEVGDLQGLVGYFLVDELGFVGYVLRHRLVLSIALFLIIITSIILILILRLVVLNLVLLNLREGEFALDVLKLLGLTLGTGGTGVLTQDCFLLLPLLQIFDGVINLVGLVFLLTIFVGLLIVVLVLVYVVLSVFVICRQHLHLELCSLFLL